MDLLHESGKVLRRAKLMNSFIEWNQCVVDGARVFHGNDLIDRLLRRRKPIILDLLKCSNVGLGAPQCWLRHSFLSDESDSKCEHKSRQNYEPQKKNHP